MPPTSRQVKLRASCDSCNESRVRCSQTHPICERCLKNNIKCIYGISQRAGRYRASNSNRGLDVPNQQASSPLNDSTFLTLQSPDSRILDDFLQNSFPMLDHHEFSESNIFTDLFGTISPSPTPNASEMIAVDDIQDMKCTCVSTVFLFLSSNPILTGTAPVPIDSCLVQGRESINICERILNCVSSSRHPYSSLITVALLIDRIVAMYDKARQNYHQTLLVPSYTAMSTGSSPVVPLSQTSLQNSSSSSIAENVQASHVDLCTEDLSRHLEAYSRRSAFIGEYQLDEDDDANLTFRVVFRHLSRIENIIKTFRNGMSGEDHMSSSAMEGIKSTTESQESEYDGQIFVCLELVDLIQRQLNVVRRFWESICKESESCQSHHS